MAKARTFDTARSLDALAKALGVNMESSTLPPPASGAEEAAAAGKPYYGYDSDGKWTLILPEQRVTTDKRRVLDVREGAGQGVRNKALRGILEEDSMRAGTFGDTAQFRASLDTERNRRQLEFDKQNLSRINALRKELGLPQVSPEAPAAQSAVTGEPLQATQLVRPRVGPPKKRNPFGTNN